MYVNVEFHICGILDEVNASMQAIINALLLVVFLIYLSNEHLLIRVFTGKRK